jgi:hypothetical protein
VWRSVCRVSGRPVRGGVALAVGLLLVLPAAAGSARRATPAENAITSFAGDPLHADASFAAISAQLANPAALRAAALEYLGSPSYPVHFAALYALSLTAAPGRADDALASLPGSAGVNDRVLASAGLAASGDTRGLPVLIALLGDASWLSYRDPPEHAWQLARVALLELTRQDLGLVHASTAAAAHRAQQAWTRWWQTNGSSLRWDPTQRRYVSGALARRVLAASAIPSRPTTARHATQNQVAVSGSRVTITVPLDVMGGRPVYWYPGEGQSQPTDHTGAWKAAAEKAWNDAFKRYHFHPACPAGSTPTKTGLHLHLKLDIQVVPLGQTGRPNADKVFFDNNPQLRSWVQLDHRKGNDSSSVYDNGNADNARWGPEDGWTIAHETGHLLGIGDDYTDQTQNGQTVSVPNHGREQTMMAQQNGRIDRQLIDRLGKLLQQAGVLPPGAGCTPAKPTGKLNRWFGDVKYSYAIDEKISPPNEEHNTRDQRLTVVVPRRGPATWSGSYSETDSGPVTGGGCPTYIATSTFVGSGSGKVDSLFQILSFGGDGSYEVGLPQVSFELIATRDQGLGANCAPRPPLIVPMRGGTGGVSTPAGGPHAERALRNAKVLRGSYHESLDASLGSGSDVTRGGWTLTWSFQRAG